MNLNPEIINVLVETLQLKFGFATVSQLDRAVADVLRKTQERAARREGFSFSTMIRGLRCLKNEAINPQTQEQDVAYVKALTTGSTPGSYLVPTIAAEEIIQYLTIGGVARSAGFRVWPLNGIQKLNMPVATAAPSWVWMAQNSVQTATDPNLGQMPFDLHERRALVSVPNQLIKVSVPAFDTLLAELIGLGAAEHEDQAIFATSTVSGGPTALMSAANITSVNCAGSANGGNIGYSDVLNCLAQAATVKAKGPFVWICSARTFYSRLLALLDLQSRPLTIPTATSGLYDGIRYSLMGYPVFITPYILENESLGSGSSQSHLIFTNPKYCHIAEDSQMEFAISTERFFDAGQTAIRGISHMDTGFSPAAGIVVLKGIN